MFQDQVRGLGIGALLHDVGKIKIRVLNDNSEITPNAAKIALQHYDGCN